jgi:hypothetical protein
MNGPPVEHLVGCVPLDAGEMLLVEAPRDVLVYVAQGRVWITEEDSADDVVLASEGWFRLARAGTAIVEALAPAILLLTAPSETGYAASVRTVARPARAPAATRAPSPRRPVAVPQLAATRS